MLVVLRALDHAQGSAFENGQHIRQRPTASISVSMRIVRPGRFSRRSKHDRVDGPAKRRIASNFAFLSFAELICRTTSVLVTLSLPSRWGRTATAGSSSPSASSSGWSCCCATAATLSSDARTFAASAADPPAGRPSPGVQVVIRPDPVPRVALVGSLTLRDRSDWRILSLYGLMLFTTAIGLDYVYRGTERMGLVAISLCVRTASTRSASSVWCATPRRITWVPIWLTVGELSGIAIVWASYLRNYRVPRPRLGLRFLS